MTVAVDIVPSPLGVFLSKIFDWSYAILINQCYHGKIQLIVGALTELYSTIILSETTKENITLSITLKHQSNAR